MASQKMKFKMNIKELSFEFEGDFEHGQKIQTGISKALGEIANLQTGAMGLPPTRPAEARVVEAAALPAFSRPRRRRKRPPAEGGEADGTGAEETEGSEAVARKSSGSSPMKLLLGLRKDGFFEGGKTTADIVTHVQTKGHTKLNTRSFTAQLVALCKKDILTRSDSGDGTWKYAPGTKDE